MDGRFERRFMRPTNLAVMVSALAVLAAISGCAQITRYARGPQPRAASPGPDWKMLSPELGVNEFESSPAVQIRGRLAGISELVAEGRTLLFRMTDVEFGFGDKVPEASFSLLLWGPGMPDLKPGAQISVVMNRRQPRELIVTDERGPVIRAFSGEVLPPPDGVNPIHLAALPETGYSEVVLSDLLCNHTWVHSRIAVTTDESRLVMKPGEHPTLTGTHAGYSMKWLMSGADSMFLDESSCQEDIEPSAWFVWMRVATLGKAKQDTFRKLRR